MSPNEKRTFKDSVYAQFARIGGALAHPKRLELLDVLAQGERSVEQLATETGMPVASASQHLRTLYRERLVLTRREGTFVYYRPASDRVVVLWTALQRIAEEQLAEIERIVSDYGLRHDRLVPVSADQLSRKLSDVTVLDVRPGLEYEHGHIAGARSIPLDELGARLAELPRDAEIVAYCRGPYCVFAFDAARILLENGFKARVFEEGFPSWKLSGHPVEAGPMRTEHSSSG